MRRYAARHRLHRGPRPHRHDSRAHSGMRQGRTIATASTTTARRASRHLKPAQALLENDRLMAFCDRNPGKTPYPQRSRPSQPSKAPPATSAKGPLKPLNIQSYLPPSRFRMVILPMRQKRLLPVGTQASGKADQPNAETDQGGATQTYACKCRGHGEVAGQGAWGVAELLCSPRLRPVPVSLC